MKQAIQVNVVPRVHKVLQDLRVNRVGKDQWVCKALKDPKVSKVLGETMDQEVLKEKQVLMATTASMARKGP